MRYFIGNLVRGEAAEFCKATCADLTARFGITNVTDITVPHIKIKSPFDFRDYEMIERIVANCATIAPQPITISGWNHFGTRTAYMDIPDLSTELRKSLTDILDNFRAARISVLPLEYELHMHLSVARFLTPETYDAISKYLATIPAPKFDIALDNLTIFSKELNEKNWKVVKTFPLVGTK